MRRFRRPDGAQCVDLAWERLTNEIDPVRPVKIMVGASPGGGTDIIARMLADKYQGAFGQVFVVENRPGAGNTIAADVAARAAPDDYTLLVATNSAQAIAPHMMKLAFDPIKDLAPIALIVVVPNVVAVAPTVAANNVRDLVAEIKFKPGAFSCGSSGIGSTQHLACEAFALATGTSIVHIPYKGSAPALTDLVGGTAGTPRDIQMRLYAETMKVLAMPDIRRKLEGLGGEPGTLTAEQFGAMNKADFERFGKLVKDANIKMER